MCVCVCVCVCVFLLLRLCVTTAATVFASDFYAKATTLEQAFLTNLSPRPFDESLLWDLIIQLTSGLCLGSKGRWEYEGGEEGPAVA